MQNEIQVSEHSLEIRDRSRAVVTGVQDVDCFNEQIVVLATPLGSLTITGENLNISQLNLEEHRLVVEGEIASAEYGTQKKSRGGFWGRLLR